jgi:hypothetical protein
MLLLDGPTSAMTAGSWSVSSIGWDRRGETQPSTVAPRQKRRRGRPCARRFARPQRPRRPVSGRAARAIPSFGLSLASRCSQCSATISRISGSSCRSSCGSQSAGKLRRRVSVWECPFQRPPYANRSKHFPLFEVKRNQYGSIEHCRC